MRGQGHKIAGARITRPSGHGPGWPDLLLSCSSRATSPSSYQNGLEVRLLGVCARLVQVSERQCPLPAGFRGGRPKSPDGRGKYRAVMALSRMGAGYINRGRELAILGVASTSPAPRATRSGAPSTRVSRARDRLQGLHGGAAFLSRRLISGYYYFTVALQALAPSNRTQSHWRHARCATIDRPGTGLVLPSLPSCLFIPSAVQLLFLLVGGVLGCAPGRLFLFSP